MKILSVVSFLIAVSVGVYVMAAKPEEKKIAYINNGELLSSFKMALEMDEKLKAIEQSKQLVLDSMIMQIKTLDATKQKDEIEKQKNIFLMKRSSFTEEISKIKQSSNEKIANQINQYVKEFAEENNFDFVLGAAGNANIWYSKETNNVTKDVIQYANNKYDGKK
jgi:outer membrane protein